MFAICFDRDHKPGSTPARITHAALRRMLRRTAQTPAPQPPPVDALLLKFGRVLETRPETRRALDRLAIDLLNENTRDRALTETPLSRSVQDIANSLQDLERTRPDVIRAVGSVLDAVIAQIILTFDRQQDGGR